MPRELQTPELVGVLYRSTSVPEIPSTPAKRVAFLISVLVLVAVLVFAVLS
jgi:hypothetical protein